MNGITSSSNASVVQLDAYKELIMKTVITNGRLVLPYGVREGSILVEDGKIQSVSFDSFSHPSDAEVINADGCFVSPGFIDMHTHGAGGYDGTNSTSSVSKPLQKLIKRTQPAGLVIGKAVPMRPMPGMMYYADSIKVREEDITRFDTIDVSSFNCNGKRVRALNKRGSFKAFTVPSDGIISASHFSAVIHRILIPLNTSPGICRVYRISEFYDRSRPISKDDLVELSVPAELHPPVSPNLSLIRMESNNGNNQYTVKVNKPCLKIEQNYTKHYFGDIDLSVPLRITGALGFERQNPWYKVYYRRIHRKRYARSTGYYMKIDPKRMTRTRYKMNDSIGNKHYGINQSATKNSGISGYYGKLWIYKKFRHKFYRAVEIEYRTGHRIYTGL